MGPARHNASSLLSPEGFFLGKMGFREALAAGDVALPQVRRRGCRGIFILIFKSQPRGYHWKSLGRKRTLGTLSSSKAGAVAS